MAHAFGQLMFTPQVKAVQSRMGSRGAYERVEASDAAPRDAIGPAEAAFIASRDSFYMATVSETGWPYVQHRGGPPGFLAVLDERTLAFADFRGNRQYVSVGNLLSDDRVSLILMDYPNRQRLKVLGRVRLVEASEDPQLMERLRPADYRAKVERAFIIDVAAFDWNCPQHITPRFTKAELAALARRPDAQTQRTSRMIRPPIPPFDTATAREKVRLAEDAWNSRDPERVALAYTPDSRWRNRTEQFEGRDAIVSFLTRKWRRELDYRLTKELWTFSEDRIAVRFAYEWRDDSGSWFRSYGNENWEFDEQGLMRLRIASINDLPIAESDRLFRWPLGRRPDDAPELSELGL